VSKHMIRAIPVLILFLLAGVHRASAQGVSVYFGAGTATDGAATTPGCAPKFILDPVTSTCEPGPVIDGTFGVFGADFMITPHLGVNGEYSFRFAQADYLPAAGLNARPAFYDFNAVYEPLTAVGRVVPVLEGGIGGSKLSLYFNQANCITSICSSSSQVVATSNHFQLHAAVGVKLYVRSDLFIKPQIDFHWAHNLSQQYASDFVPQYTISVGYTFGRH
jgi:hypothetical protein